MSFVRGRYIQGRVGSGRVVSGEWVESGRRVDGVGGEWAGSRRGVSWECVEVETGRGVCEEWVGSV